MPKGKKLKVQDRMGVDIITSLYQTSLNNSKGRTTKEIRKNAFDMCKNAIEDINTLSKTEIDRVGDLMDKRAPKRRVPKRKAEKLLARAVNKKFKKSTKKGKKK